MRKCCSSCSAVLLAFLLQSSVIGLQPLFAQVPGILSYQGRVVVNNTNFNGTGQFQFALVDSVTNSLWSNDGTSVLGSEPSNAVSLAVSKGLYSVLLGDTSLMNMTAVPASVFTSSQVYLRTWFNDGVDGFQQLSPDQRIAAVGYALMAANVPDGAITSNKLATGAVDNSKLARSSLTVATGAGLSGGSIVSLGGTVTLSNSGVLFVGVTSPLMSSGGQTPSLAIQQANGSQGGYLSGNDWSTFNGKLSGGGVANYVPQYEGVSLLGPSQIYQAANGAVGIGTASPVSALHVIGTVTATNFSGSGAGLTNLSGNAFAAGSIGTAAIANGAIGSSQLASNLTVSGTLAASSLAGNGAGLTNLNASQLASGTIPLAQLPGAVVTNSSSGVSLSGSFTGSFQGNGAGLTNLPGSGFAWQIVTGTNQQAQSNTGYLATNSGVVTITLPASPNVGDIVRVTGVGTGGWQIVQNAGQGFSYTNRYLFSGSETNVTLNPGTYNIIAYGAQGGNGNGGGGGLGSEMSAEFNFSASTALTILVGGAGGAGGSYGAGGGGGSFVVNGSTPLIIAGGGGGAYGRGGGPGLIGTNGGSGGIYGGGNDGGTGGGGGGSTSQDGDGAGGGGYYVGGGQYGGGGDNAGGAGSSYVGGGAGGYSGILAGDGGYGDGGYGGDGAGGGGGGYSGGGGGGIGYNGGGGDSYIDASAVTNGTELAGVQSGNGEIDIAQLTAVVVTKFAGGQNTAVELQYIGNGQFIRISQEGTSSAY